MRKLLLIVAAAVMLLAVSCDVNKEPPEPQYNVPYLTVKNETGKVLTLDVCNGSDEILYHVVSDTMKVAANDIKVKGYCILREEMRIEPGTEWTAYPVKIISKVCEQSLTLDNKIYVLHVTYNSSTNGLEFNLEEKH